MKQLIQIFIFLSCAQILCAQSPLDKKINFEAIDIPLETALLNLLNNDDAPISFSNNLIPKSIKINIEKKQYRLDNLLNLLLKRTELSWQLIGNQIVIIKLPFDQRPKYTLTGFIENMETGERVLGANIFSPDLLIGTTSNEFGFYSLSLPAGTHEIAYSYLGFERAFATINLYENIELNKELKPIFLTEILVIPPTDSLFLKSPDISTDQVIIDNIQQFPTLGGEPDVVRLIHTLPGVQTGADGFGSISVRGGSGDQNLFLLDGVPVYNSMHALGLFSIYNSSAILKATFYKGVFPAKFGGRLSSVLDVRTKEGNRKRALMETDIGLTSVKLTAEGPLGKKKNASFFVSGRRALFDFYSVPYTQKTRRNKGIEGYLGYFFYDLNFKLNQRISKKDQIYLSVYNGADDFKDIRDEVENIQDTTIFLTEHDTLLWGNTIASFRWNRIHNEKLFSNVTLAYSRFFYESDQFVNYQNFIGQMEDSRAVLFLRHSSFNEDWAGKVDFEYYPNEKQEISFGIHATKHKFQPGVVNFTKAAQLENIDLDTVGRNNNLLESYEIDAYFQDEIKINKNITTNIGLRASSLLVNDEWQISWQPRVLIRLFPEKKLSFKIAAGKHTQNLHLLSASSLGLPKDIWVSATTRRKPQQSWQFVGGLGYKLQNGLELSLESYYKKMTNLLVFNEGSIDRTSSSNWESKVSEGSGAAYGIEFLLKKQAGKTTGWLGYTWGHTNRQFDILVNQGNQFSTRLDRRHNVNIQLLHKINKRWSVSTGWVFATGSAYTAPLGEYVITLPSVDEEDPSIELINVSDIPQINSERFPNYHRLDFGFNYHFSKRKLRHAIKFGVYNAYLRKNPTYRNSRQVLDSTDKLKTELIQVTLLPIFPTLRYSVIFL